MTGRTVGLVLGVRTCLVTRVVMKVMTRLTGMVSALRDSRVFAPTMHTEQSSSMGTVFVYKRSSLAASSEFLTLRVTLHLFFRRVRVVLGLELFVLSLIDLLASLDRVLEVVPRVPVRLLLTRRVQVSMAVCVPLMSLIATLLVSRRRAVLGRLRRSIESALISLESGTLRMDL